MKEGSPAPRCGCFDPPPAGADRTTKQKSPDVSRGKPAGGAGEEDNAIDHVAHVRKMV